MHEYIVQRIHKTAYTHFMVCTRIFFNIFVRAKGYNIIHTKRHYTALYTRFFYARERAHKCPRTDNGWPSRSLRGAWDA